MMERLTSIIWKNILSNKIRFIVIIITLNLSTAVILSVFSSKSSIEKLLNDQLQGKLRQNHLIIKSAIPANHFFSIDIANKIKRYNMIEAVSPVLRYCKHYEKGNKIFPIVLEGVIPEAENSFMANKIIEGRFLKTTDGHVIIVSKGYARETGFHLGDTISFIQRKLDKRNMKIVKEREIKFLIIGISNIEDEDERLGMVPLKILQTIYKKPGKVSRIYVKVKRGENINAVKKSIEKILGNDFFVYYAKNYFYNNIYQNMYDLIYLGIIACVTLVLIIIGCFISNLYYAILDKRKKDLYVLRSLGASNYQIFNCLFGEILVIGLCGSVGGVILGIPLAMVGHYFASKLFDITILPFNITFTDIGIAFCGSYFLLILLTIYRIIQYSSKKFNWKVMSE